jgi:hypothetical protein
VSRTRETKNEAGRNFRFTPELKSVLVGSVNMCAKSNIASAGLFRGHSACPAATGSATSGKYRRPPAVSLVCPADSSTTFDEPR